MSTALAVTTPALAQTTGGNIRGKLTVDLGRLELTATSVDFYKRNPMFAMFGLIGALFGLRSRGKLNLTLRLADITALARGKFGRNKNVLEVTTADGTSHRLLVDKYDDFTARLREELGRGGRLESSGDDRWTVAKR